MVGSGRRSGREWKERGREGKRRKTTRRMSGESTTARGDVGVEFRSQLSNYLQHRPKYTAAATTDRGLPDVNVAGR